MLSRVTYYLAPLVLVAIVGAGLYALPSPTPVTASELAEAAVARIKVGQPTRGIYLIDEALAKEPRNYRANFVAAAYYMQVKQYDKAAPHLATALEVRQDDSELLFMLGVLCQQRQQYVDAANWYKRAHAKAPTDPKIAYNQGMLHIIVMDYPKAKAFFEEYLRLSPQAADRAFVKDKIQEINERLGEKRG